MCFNRDRKNGSFGYHLKAWLYKSLHKADAKNSHCQTSRTANKKTSVQKCLQQCYKDTDIYLSRIITSDETWVHHYDPLTNRQSMEWHHHSELLKRKVKVQNSVSKVMASILRDSKVILLVGFLDRSLIVKCWQGSFMLEQTLCRQF